MRLGLAATQNSRFGNLPVTKTGSILIGVWTAWALTIGISATTQITAKTSGVYQTAADFENHRLSFEGDCGSKTHKLELHDVLNKTYIDVTHGSEKHRFAKSAVFGFRACDGNDYRFAANLEYLILEAKDIYVYAREIPTSQGKGFQITRLWFFSVGSAGSVLPLTLEQLMRAFPNNLRFHDSLRSAFGGGENIAQYDATHMCFRVNQLLVASAQSKGPSERK